jgi:hypothetical protein
MSSSVAAIEIAASNQAWGSNNQLNDLLVRTVAPSQQIVIAGNSNVGLRVSNDTVWVQNNLQALTVTAPTVISTSNLVASNVTACNVTASNATVGVLNVSSLQGVGAGGLGTAVVQHRLHLASNASLAWYPANTWNTRPLNAVLANTNSNVVGLTNNQVWLLPGTYVCAFQGLGGAGANNSTIAYRLWNSNTTAVVEGSTLNSGFNSINLVDGILTTTSPSNAVEFQMKGATSNQALCWINGTLSNVFSSLTLTRLA